MSTTTIVIIVIVVALIILALYFGFIGEVVEAIIDCFTD